MIRDNKINIIQSTFDNKTKHVQRLNTCMHINKYNYVCKSSIFI